MGKAPIVIALLVVGVFAIWRFEPFVTQDREVIASTPSPPPVYVESPATLPGHANACLDQMPLDSHSQVFQVIVQDAPKSSPALDFTFKAPGYRRQVQLPGGYPVGPVEVNLNPPKKSVLGTVCIRNTGAQKVLLRGSTEGRTQSRPNLTVNGAPVGIRVTSKFRERQPSSLIARTPDILEHASTLKPVPLWFVWVLALVALIGIPALVLTAFARTAVAPDGVVVDPAAAASPVPLPWLGPAVRGGWARGRALVERIAAPWALGVLLFVVFAYLLSHALRVRGFQLDEDAYVYFARFTREHLPNALWNTTVINRGLQRLEPWLLMFPLALFKGTTAFAIGHFLNVLAYTSAGIPAYLIVRGFGLRGGWRVLAAFLTLVVPWAVVATTFLGEPLGYPAFCWSLWAIWRAAADPRPRHDVLAVALIVTACFARSSMLVLIPLLYVVVVVQLARFGPRDTRQALRPHWPLVAFVGLAIVMYVLSKSGALPQVGALTGYYGTSPQGISSAFLQKNWVYVARTTIGTGFISLVIGGAWLAARAVRPRDAMTHALALTGAGAILLVLYSNATAGTDERYIIYLAFPLAIATVIALARREAPWLLVLVAGVLAARLLRHQSFNTEGGPFGYFIGPAETFYARTVLLRLSVLHPANDPRNIALFFELLLTAACAYAMTRRRYARRVVGALVVGLVLVQFAQTDYTVGRYVDQAVAGAPGGPSAKQKSWVDEKLWGKATAGYWAVDAGRSGLYAPISLDVQFWNSSIRSVIGVDAPVGVQVPPGDDLIQSHADPATGVVTANAPAPGAPRQKPFPPYLVVPADGRSAVFGTTVAKSEVAPLALVKVKPPLRLRWQVNGIDDDGWMTNGDTATVRVFASPLTPRTGQCLSVDVRSHAGWRGDWRLATDRSTQRGPLKDEDFTRVEVPLKGIGAGKTYQDVTLEGVGKQVTLEDGRKTTVQLAALDTKPCGS